MAKNGRSCNLLPEKLPGYCIVLSFASFVWVTFLIKPFLHWWRV